MLSKYAASISKSFNIPINLKLARFLQTDHASHIQNPGSEPLTIATFGDVIAETAHKYPGRIAIKSIHEDVSITYEELINKADSLGCALRANGFEKGDRIGIWSHNSSGWVISALAAARAGLISVFINPLYEKDELSYCINKMQMKGLVVGENLKNRDYYGLLNKILPEMQSSKEGSLQSKNFPSLRHIVTTGKDKLSGTTTLESLINNYKNNSEITKYSKQVKPEDGSFILMTSGTTGKPKGGLNSHIGVVNNTYFSGKRLCLQEEHQTICLQAPMFHALGSIVTLFAGLRHGSTTVVASPMYSVNANVHALCSEKCTVITGTPTMYIDMMSHFRDTLPTRLRMALTAGAPCSPHLVRQMEEKLNVMNVGALYGLTETTATVFQSMPDDSVDLVAETVGSITDHIEVKVVDDVGETVPFGSPGELMVRGYSNMLYYWDEPEKTRKTLREDGWLYTGDMFKITSEGYGSIVGRIKDIIIRGGENIAPKEIEDFLNSHPDIIDCQVVGVSDERLGEELCAVVRVRENATFTLQNMTNHCSGKLARFKIPKILKTVKEFPKTASGKVQKYKLKELIESGKL